MDKNKMKMKALLLANVKMAGGCKEQGKTQVNKKKKKMRMVINRAPQQVVTMKPGKKQTGQPGALDIAKITWRKSLLKERKAKISVMKDVLPKPPTGTSAARKLQNPEHVDIVKGMMNVPSARDMGLSVEGEVIHDKMMIATTRQLSAATGAQYSRYTVHCTLYTAHRTTYTVKTSY